ncbi:MAG TPA: aminotransferase class I/II-fold pyridoxal phosphate-dependent enzyme [Solirubrobacteraceae bacterium]|nr:aminotransferase class I/II-fold pyridoxal phosphate-dependent enzyme [Solirubrobacteraceae bacterium]
MPRFRDYYKQFEEMDPAEVSRDLRARRDEEKRRALLRVEPLDLTGSGWFEPPHPDAVNAATFALRRALHTAPDTAAVRADVAARFGLAPEQVALGHGAGELLRALLPGSGDVLLAWPGWQPLPDLVAAAGARPAPVLAGRPEGEARMVVLTSPGDATGATASRDAVRALCVRMPDATVVVDEALGEFHEPGADAAGLVGRLDNLVVVRSFSKGHALAGLRAGAALGPPGLVGGLSPSGGISAPAAAAIAWAVSEPGIAAAGRRRAVARALHEQLAEGLAGTPFAAAPAVTPFAWLSSGEEDGRAIAARLAASQVFVAPGSLWGDERHVRAQLRGPAGVERLVSALAA